MGVAFHMLSGGESAGRKPRKSLLLQAQCYNETEQLFQITVKNLSEAGVGGNCIAVPPVSIGEPVSLTLRDVKGIPGRVIWIAGKSLGVAFDRPLNAARLDLKGCWTGPKFEIDEMHQIAERCYRPGFST